MRKSILSVLCCFTAVLLFSATAGAADLYFSGKAGLTMPADSSVHFDGGADSELEFDPGFSLAAAIGSKPGRKGVRFEPLEVTYQENDADKASALGGISVDGDINIWSFMMNGYYDFMPDAAITPYIGGGVGFAVAEVSDLTSPAVSGYFLEGDEDTVFCYQGSVGVAWAINNDLTLDFSYRYFATEDPHFSIANTEFESHNVYAGVRLPF